MIPSRALFTTLLLTVAFAPVRASAQLAEVVPQGLEGVGLDQVLDAQIPLDVPFTDGDGQAATIGQYFDGVHPVLLTFNYTDCPLMCSQQLDGFVDALRKLEGVVPGDDFQIVTISIDHRETWKKAGLTKEKYIRDLGPDKARAAAKGWHFLVGAEGNIRRVSDAVGFHYKWINPTTKFSHVPAIIVATPKGHTSRYFSGWDYGPVELRRALVEASEGEIGTLSDAFFYSCFRYDPDKGATGILIMRVGGVVAVVALAALIFLLRRMEPKLGPSGGLKNPTDEKNHDTPDRAEVAR